MNGIRFYQEFANKSKTKPTGNIIAALAGRITGAAGNGVFFSGGAACYEAVAGLFDAPNSPVASTAVAIDLLREKCKRVSETKARQVHPNLFEYLDHAD